MDYDVSKIIDLHENEDYSVQGNGCQSCESYDFPDQCQSGDDCEVY